MTVIRHNSISGIVSITAAAGSNLSFYDSAGATLSLDTGNINAGVITATTANFTNATVTGDLTVQGTTTTLDTTVTEVDKLEVGANNTTVGVAITQSGTGDILRLYDGATEVFSVVDGGDITVGNSGFFYDYSTAKLGVGLDTPGSTRLHVKGHSSLNNSLLVDVNTGDSTLGFAENGTEKWRIENVTSADALRFYDVTNTAERLRINSSGNVGIGTDIIEGKLTVFATAAEPPTSGTTANSAIQLYSSLSNQMNLGLNTVNGTYGAYIQVSDNNHAVNYPLNLQPNGGTIGIGTIPKTWTSAYNVLQVGSASLVGQSEQDGQTTNWSNNAYFDTNNNRWEYGFADEASQITQSDGLIIFRTASTGTANAALSWTESARFNTSGNLAFPSGQGIDFSATSDASGSTSELLNDYEEGTFTPRLNGWNGSSYVNVTNTTSNTAGRYVKIGGWVTLYIEYVWSSMPIASGNPWYIYDVPFAPETNHSSAGSMAQVGCVTNAYSMDFVKSSGYQSPLFIYSRNSQSSYTNVSNNGGSGQFKATITYFTNA